MPRASPDLPWNVRLLVKSLAFFVDVCRRSNGTFNRSLINLLDLKASPISKPVKGLQSSDVMVDKSRNLWFRLYTPLHHATTINLPVIVYFHGGGFVLMASDSKSYDHFCQRLARELPAVIVSVNYRLAPEHRYPSAYDDGFDVLKFIDGADFKDRLPEIASLKKCLVAGDSSGGNLAHHVAVKAAEHEFDDLRIVGVIALQPFFGGQERTKSEIRLDGAPLIRLDRTEWMWKAFLPDGSDRDHPAANVFGPKSVEISGLKFPATMVVVGGFDPLQDWQKGYYLGLKKQAAIMARTSPDLPWNVRLFVNSISFFVDVCRRSNGTFNRTFMNLLDWKASPISKPVKGLQSSDVMVDKSRNLWFRLYTPLHHAATTGLPVIVYFHGGGFVLMAADSKTHDDFCQRLSRELPSIIVSVNYRLAPEHRCPSAFEDGFDVLKFIDGADFKGCLPANANLKKCFVAGDSAGGNLAHHVAVKAAEHEFDELRIVGVIALQPFFGGQERTESETRLVGAPLVNMDRADWMWKAFLPDGSDRDHPAVNVFGPKSVEISGLKFPATMVVVGGFDPLQDWQKRYYSGLKKQGKEAHLIEYPNAIHGFYIFPVLQESSTLIKEMSEFISNNA